VLSLRVFESSWQYEMAECFMSSYTLMLESKRLILNRVRKRTHGQSARSLRVEARALEAEIDRLGDKRDAWALRCSPEEPQRWVTLYQRLISRYQETRDQLRQELHRMDPESRRQFLTSDLPSLETEIGHFRSQLRYWQRRLLEQSASSLQPEPARVGATAHLRLVREEVIPDA
jgi:hypothetical protein